MKQENKHMDDLAKKLLKNMESKIPEGSWERISDELDLRNNKPIPLYKRYRYLAASVIIIGLTLASIFMFDQKTIHELPIAQDQSDNQLISDTLQHTDIQNKELLNQKEELPSENQIAYQNTEEEVTKNTYNIERTENTKKEIIPNSNKTKTQLLVFSYMETKLFNQTISMEQSLLKNTFKKLEMDLDSWKATFADEQLAERNEIVSSKNRWKLGLAYSPSYAQSSGSANQNQSLSADFGANRNLSNTEKLNTTYTFGFNIAYALSKRFSIQSGMYFQKHENEISVNTLVNAENFNQLNNTRSSNGNIQIQKEVSFAMGSGLSGLIGDEKIAEFQPSSDLYQRFDYLEIPLLLNYKLIDLKYSISIQTGIHTGFVVRNNVYLKNYDSQNIGETQNINNIVFRSVIGLSFEYPLFTKFYFNLSPSYKYQLNNLNKSSEFKSKFNFIDIKTGITYRF